MQKFLVEISAQLKASADLKLKVAAEMGEDIAKAIQAVIDSYKNDGKVLFFGNGGSAADAQHLAAEFACRFKINRRPLPALALTTDTSFLTACSNDYSFNDIFVRQVEAFCKKGDVVFGISTSGNSKNVELGLKKAKEMGAVAVAFLGKDGGSIKDIVDIPLIIPSDDTPRIQESHIAIGHILCDVVEKELFGEKK